MRRFAWMATRDKKLWVAWTLAGIVKVKANTFPPVHLLVKGKLLGYSVYCGAFRISWTPDLTVAIAVAEDIVMRHMEQRRDRA